MAQVEYCPDCDSLLCILPVNTANTLVHNAGSLSSSMTHNGCKRNDDDSKAARRAWCSTCKKVVDL